MAYPIKYIENNLVFNHDGECFAYYELLPYNYSFLSPNRNIRYTIRSVSLSPRTGTGRFMPCKSAPNPAYGQHRNAPNRK